MKKELQWLVDKKEFISIYRIEKVLGMGEGTLKKFVDGKRALPEQWQAPITQWVKTFKK